MALAEPGTGRLQIAHRVDVQPGGRNRDDNIGTAKIEAFDDRGIAGKVSRQVVQEVFAGHTEMEGAIDQPLRDLTRRKQQDIGVRQAFQLCRVAAVAAALAQFEACAGKPAFSIVFQPPFGRYGELEPGHAVAPSVRRSGRTTPPIPVVSILPSERRASSVS